jgi:DNA-binding CsgD family transcriptional regulator
MSAAFGLPTVMVGALLIRGDKVGGRFYFGNWSDEWTSVYLEKVFADDPLVHEARRRMSPFTWSELWAEGDLPQAVRDVIEMGRQRGWHEGLAVPIHGPGGYLGLVSFAGGAVKLSAADRALLLVLAHAAHAAHQRGKALYGNKIDAPIRLTRRELQTMRWVSRGTTDAQIGAILKLSATTVHYYLEQAQRKLGVRSRSQPVSELALRELLLRDDLERPPRNVGARPNRRSTGRIGPDKWTADGKPLQTEGVPFQPLCGYSRRCRYGSAGREF